jgi:uncharacterized membrane protein
MIDKSEYTKSNKKYQITIYFYKTLWYNFFIIIGRIKRMRSCKEYKKIAWDLLIKNPGKFFLFSLMCEVVISAISGTGFGFFIIGPFIVGMLLFYLRAIRGEEAEFAAFFEPILKNDFIRTVVLYILKTLYIILWSLLFIIPGIIKSYSYSMAEFVAIDNLSLSAEDCLKTSSKMMNGYKFKLFLLDLSFIGWYILGVLALFIGVVFVNAYHKLARAAFYEDLKKKSA